MHTRSAFAALTLAAGAALACSSSSDPAAPPPLLTDLPRELTADEQTIQIASNTFSFQLLSRLSSADPNKNIFVSPLSVSFALGMALNGASGETHSQISQTLGFGGLPEARINEGYRGLVELLRSLDSSIQMEIANSMWHDDLYSIQAGFTDALTAWFGAGVFARDFAAPATVTDINDWVRDRTHGKIPTIIDDIDSQEIMFLINAIFFHGKWRSPFDPRQTSDGFFHTLDARQLPVRVMSRDDDNLTFIHDQDLVAANLTYGNGAFAMALMRPNGAETVNEFAESLTVQQWSSIRQRFHTGKAMLRMPKFDLEYKRSMKDDLVALGMVRPFEENAEFPRMVIIDPSRRLFISRVEHRAAVEVDELGTTAAAATAVGVGVTSAPPQLDFDRPFVFVIYEQLSGTILFMGKVLELPAN